MRLAAEAESAAVVSGRRRPGWYKMGMTALISVAQTTVTEASV